MNYKEILQSYGLQDMCSFYLSGDSVLNWVCEAHAEMDSTESGISSLLLFSPIQLICDPMDWGPPESSVHGISQARMLVWVAISFSRGSSWPRDQTCISCTAGGLFYHWATWEASWNQPHQPKSQLCHLLAP